MVNILDAHPRIENQIAFWINESQLQVLLADSLVECERF